METKLNAKETVTYDKEKIIEVIRDLNLLVVSTDRIGSVETADHTEEQYNAMFVRFFDELGFARKLADARVTLSEAFSDQVGEDGMDELERKMQDLEFWTEDKS